MAEIAPTRCRESIAPGIVTRDGRTVYPTGVEWVIAFAVAGCPWAIAMIESGQLERDQATLWCGDGI